MRKLTPYQDRLARLRAEQMLSEKQISQLIGKALGTIKNEFILIRRILGILSFEEAYRDYKKRENKKDGAAPVTSHPSDSDFNSNESSGLELDRDSRSML